MIQLSRPSFDAGVVDAINKHSIKGPAILPLQRLFLIAAVYDIQIVPFCVPSEENMVADMASRYNYKRLANLGLQISKLPKSANLRRKLSSFFSTPLRQALDGTMIKSSRITPRSVNNMCIILSPSRLRLPHTGSPTSCPSSSLQPLRVTSVLSDPSTFKQESIHRESTMLASPLHGIHGSPIHICHASHADTSPSTPRQ